MLVPVAEGTYDYWINICPMDATFSARQAVSTLRRAKAGGTKPWGQITLTDQPIIEQLVENAGASVELPTNLGRLLRLIGAINSVANEHLRKSITKSVLEEYRK
jgi:hypothetical protein